MTKVIGLDGGSMDIAAADPTENSFGIQKAVVFGAHSLTTLLEAAS